jgi:MFS family permease
MQSQLAQKPKYKFSLIAYLVVRITTALAGQMITVAVGWQIYALTKSTFYLGLVGLMQFIPMILMTLFAGYAADHFNRKIIICLCAAAQAICFILLAIGSRFGVINTSAILAFAFMIGGINALQGPAIQAILPGIVEMADFAKATALGSSSFQVATIIGPALGGLLYVLGAYTVYLASAFSILIASIVILFVKVTPRESKREPVTVKSLLAGVSYIGSRPIILGAISLDLFAVLFGGATALLPVYAATILKIGTIGLGILRSAPAIGALFVSFLLARRPVGRKVGMSMFTAVIIFGLATICFAVSRSFYLSLAALIVLGASDVVSVVIRSTLVQLQTPDAMRGRVSSVNQVFIGTSNQLGEFESGLTATWFGTVPAALIGGIGTICVVALWMRIFPSLRKMDKFEQNTI